MPVVVEGGENNERCQDEMKKREREREREKKVHSPAPAASLPSGTSFLSV